MFFTAFHLLKKIDEVNAHGTKDTVVSIWLKGSSTVAQMMGYTIAIHNGKMHLPIRIMEDTGHKLGELAPDVKLSCKVATIEVLEGTEVGSIL